jgi:hypothetical protein
MVDSPEHRLAAEHLQSLKQWRGVFSATNGDANGLEHLAGLNL